MRCEKAVRPGYAADIREFLRPARDQVLSGREVGFIEVQANVHGRAAAFGGFDLDAAADQCDPFFHPDNSSSAADVARSRFVDNVEANAVILDDKDDAVVAVFEENADAGCISVLGDVVEGLLRDAVIQRGCRSGETTAR